MLATTLLARVTRSKTRMVQTKITPAPQLRGAGRAYQVFGRDCQTAHRKTPHIGPHDTQNHKPQNPCRILEFAVGRQRGGARRRRGTATAAPVVIREGCRGRNSFEVEIGMNREDELRPMAFFVVALLILLLVVA